MYTGEHVVEAVHDGRRLDQWVADHEADLTRSRAARLIRAGSITINGAPARAATRVRAGDRVAIRVPPVQGALTPEYAPLEVLLETSEFVVINKPAGLTMYPGAGRAGGTLANRLIAQFPDTQAIGHPRRPGIVHRLDKETSGVVVVARTHGAYDLLSRAFARRAVRKRYLLLARGRPNPSQGRIDVPIGRDVRNRTRMAATWRGRAAETGYEVLGAGAGASLVLARPSSGRTHQIRVHMAAIGHPVLGDRTYGGGKGGAERTMLHAWSLEFTDPVGVEWVAAASPPADFVNASSDLGLQIPATPASGVQTG